MVNGGGSGNTGGNGDGGCKGRVGGSSGGHDGKNFGGAGHLFTLYRPSAKILVQLDLKLIFSCIQATLYEGMSISWLVCVFVCHQVFSRMYATL